MIKKIPWLYPLRRFRMPCAPSEFSFIHPYVITNDLEKPVMGTLAEDEAAARIVLPSVWANEWVGVSLHVLVQILVGQVEVERPNPWEIEISHSDAKTTARAAYYLMRERLLFLDRNFIIYPTPSLVTKLRMAS